MRITKFYLIECTILSHILDNHVGELLLGFVGVILKDSFTLVIGANCEHDIKTKTS